MVGAWYWRGVWFSTVIVSSWLELDWTVTLAELCNHLWFYNTLKSAIIKCIQTKYSMSCCCKCNNPDQQLNSCTDNKQHMSSETLSSRLSSLIWITWCEQQWIAECTLHVHTSCVTTSLHMYIHNTFPLLTLVYFGARLWRYFFNWGEPERAPH